MNEEFNWWVQTRFVDSTRGFHTQFEALIYFEELNEEASLVDFTNDEYGEEIDYKYNY